MRHRSLLVLPVLMLLLAALTLPSAASAKFEVGLNQGGFSTSTTSVREFGRYPGDAGPGTYHFEYFPYTFQFDHNCDTLDWSGAQRTPDRHISAVGDTLVSENIAGLQQ